MPAHTTRCSTTARTGHIARGVLHVHAGATLLSPFCRCAPNSNIFRHFEFVGHVSKFLRPHRENQLAQQTSDFGAKGEISNTRARTREEKEGRPPLPFACFPRAFQQLAKKTNRRLPRRLRENSLCNICYRVVLQRLVPQCVPVLIKMDSILLLQQLRVLLHTTLQKWTLMQHFVGGSFGRSVAAKVGPCVQALVKQYHKSVFNIVIRARIFQWVTCVVWLPVQCEKWENLRSTTQLM